MTNQATDSEGRTVTPKLGHDLVLGESKTQGLQPIDQPGST